MYYWCYITLPQELRAPELPELQVLHQEPQELHQEPQELHQEPQELREREQGPRS